MRLLVTVLSELLGLAVAGWTIEARRRVEDRGDAAEQLKAAGRGLRRLKALEALVRMMRE